MRTVLIFLSCSLFALTALSQHFDQITKLTAADRGRSRNPDEHFGYAVAVSGNYAVVGARGESINESSSNPLLEAGAIYVFKKNALTGNWEKKQKLSATDRQEYDWFGFSVAISGDYIVAGAYFADDGITQSTGKAYVYVRDPVSDTWSEEAILEASDKEEYDWFGYDVSIDGNYIAVGAHKEGVASGDEQGAVYVFKTDGGGAWTQEAKLIAADRAGGDWLGLSVAISGNTVIAGAPNNDNGVSNGGAAYIFVSDGAGNWIQEQRILAGDRTAEDIFGYSVAIDANYAVVGALQDDEDAAGLNPLANAGSAYVFIRNTGVWTQQHKIVAPDRATADWFGYSLSISGDHIIAGAYQEDEDATGANTVSRAGSAYLFSRSGNSWTMTQKLTAPVRAEDDYFSFDVAINGNNLFAGAWQEDENETETGTIINAGSVFVFSRNGANWSFQQKLNDFESGGFDLLGYYVAADSMYAIAGAWQDGEDANGVNTITQAGSAYIYRRDTATGLWLQQQKIVAADRNTGALFGYSVAINQDYAFITAYNEKFDEDGNNELEEAGAVYVFRRSGTAWAQTQKLVAPVRKIGDVFGSAVAVSGNYLAVGSTYHDEDANGQNTLTSAGAMYLYKLNTGSGLWELRQKLTPTDRATDDRFGFHVAIDGDYAAGGAYLHDGGVSNAGAVYVFVRNPVTDTWSEQQKLTTSDRQSGDQFGIYVSVSGEYIIAGAYAEDHDAAGLNPFNNAGSAYIFKRNGTVWTQEQKIVASDRAANNRFGLAASIYGEYAVVAAEGNHFSATGTDSLNTSGSCYIYKRDALTGTWSQIQKIAAGDREEYAQFGYNVALYKDYIFSGTVGESKDENGQGSLFSAGAVYVYRKARNPYFSKANLPADSLGAWNSQRNGIGNAAFGFNLGRYWAVQPGDTLTLAAARNLSIAADSLITEPQSMLRINGTLQLGNTPVKAYGTLAGNGTVSLNSIYTNNGTVSPGNSAGKLTINSTGFNNANGVITAELAAGTNDSLVITQPAQLGGTMNVKLLNGFIPAVGQSFTVLTAPQVTGTFNSINYPSVPGVLFTTIYNPGSVVINTVGTLPLRLLQFSGNIHNDNSAWLKWKTEDEINVSHFELEWHTAGNDFVRIYSRSATNTPGVNLYEYLHTPLTPGDHFYRLKMIDRDGSLRYSQVVRITVGKTGYVYIYPNPVRTGQALTIYTNETGSNPLHILLYSNNGKLVLRRSINAGGNIPASLPLPALPPQQYIIRIIKDDTILYSQPLIIQN
jgi:FG-GAP repeat